MPSRPRLHASLARHWYDSLVYQPNTDEDIRSITDDTSPCFIFPPRPAWSPEIDSRFSRSARRNGSSYRRFSVLTGFRSRRSRICTEGRSSELNPLEHSAIVPGLRLGGGDFLGILVGIPKLGDFPIDRRAGRRPAE